MKNLICGLALLVAATAPSLAQGTTAGSDSNGATPIHFGTSYEISASVLGETRTVNVWLPPHHDTAETPYTVLYLIDGGVEQDFPHIAGLAQLGVISWQYEPLIVVGIETTERSTS